MTVYADILILINLYINYLLLQLTQKVLRRRFSKGRVLAASVVGALCSLIMLLPPLPGLLLFFFRLLLATGIVYLAGGEKRISYLIRQTLLFFAANVLLCGLVLLLWNLFLPNFVAVNNGVIYLNLSAVTLLAMTTLAYGLLSALDRLRPKGEEKTLFRLRVSTSNGSIECQGLLDTGNSLSDPFTGTPVVVVCYRIVEPVLPEQVKAFMERVFEKKEPIQELPVCTAVRWIPCTSVGTTQLLPAFVPEKLECFDGGKWKRAREVMVALTPHSLGGDCEALLNPSLCYDSAALSEKKEKMAVR